jgi:hypothetical protein
VTSEWLKSRSANGKKRPLQFLLFGYLDFWTFRESVDVSCSFVKLLDDAWLVGQQWNNAFDSIVTLWNEELRDLSSSALQPNHG